MMLYYFPTWRSRDPASDISIQSSLQLTWRNDAFLHVMKQEKLEYPDGEDHGMRQHSSRPYLEKSFQVNELMHL